jgi:hypothetical protein
MITIPLLIYMALKKRMKKDETWKLYLAGAAGVFVLLVIVTKR